MECNSMIEDPATGEIVKAGNSFEENEADNTVHAFNLSNVNNTVIEKSEVSIDCKNNSCEGSDSGVEVVENACNLQRTISTNSQEFVTSAQSCDSSIISCCSNYDEAFNLLVRRNSTLLDDYKLRNVDGTSENGSESSSVASTKISKRSSAAATKKKVVLENKRLTSAPTASRSRSKPPITQKPTLISRSKSTERPLPKAPKSAQKTPRTKPENPTSASKDVKKGILRTQSVKTPATTPTDDGRWPSSYSKPAPLMTRSLRGILPIDLSKPRVLTTTSETRNTLEKYATLPRRRKERSADNITDLQRNPKSRENSMTRVSTLKKQSSRESTPAKSLPPYPKKKPTTKTKIYHETSVQTALNLEDIENALAGIQFNPRSSEDVEKLCKEVQADMDNEQILKLQGKLNALTQKHESLNKEFAEQSAQLKDAEQKLKDEQLEKEGLKEELKNNNERVVAMLGCNGGNNTDENASSDSLMVLESRFQNVSSVIIKQEEEISKLNAYCRALQRDFDKSLANQTILMQQHQELEEESRELQEFMQMEKTALTDALKDSENEVKRNRLLLMQKDKEMDYKIDECKHLKRISDQRRQENLALQAKFTALESKCRELLVHQGSTVSGAAVALSSLLSRLEGLVDELVTSYNISEQELDDVIFHNEAYSNSSSSPDLTPDKCGKFIVDKSQSPKRGSSFVSAVINAIRNATAQSPFTGNRENSKDNVTDNSDSTELLDSETEPCLMMEHVLEDVVVPDGHSHNMISSGHGISSLRLTQSESLNNISIASSRHQDLLPCNVPSITELYSVSLVDQIIDVDNLITRMLKVIRIIQIWNDDYVSDLQDERDSFSGQVNTQRETNKIVVKQLKDWEVLGANLKTEVKDLLQQLSKKNVEFEELKVELNQQRVEVEKLNQDVCDLSTALSKSERNFKIKEEEAEESLKKWEATGEAPDNELLGTLVSTVYEVPKLKEKLEETEKQLQELRQEYDVCKKSHLKHLQVAVNENRRRYNAIDNALETLHNVQTVVEQCPALAKLQRELEEAIFQSVYTMPIELVFPPNVGEIVKAVECAP